MTVTASSLATLEQYNAAKMILSSPDNELYSPDQMQQFLNWATDYLESQCYQTLLLTSFLEDLVMGNLYCSTDPFGQLNIFPKHQPIVSVSSVAYRYLPSVDFTEMDSDLWVLTNNQSIIVPYNNPLYGQRFGQVRVAYSAGYDPDEMPGDLIEANILVAAHFASGGYVGQSMEGDRINTPVPNWAWGTGGKTKSIVDETISRYQRQF